MTGKRSLIYDGELFRVEHQAVDGRERPYGFIRRIGATTVLPIAEIDASSPLSETDPEVIRRTIEINTLGTMYLARVVAPSMQARKHGRIINVISQAGLQTSPNRTVYHASKWAITGFTKALQQELRDDHVSVVGYYPGAMATQFFAKAGDMKDRSSALAPEIAADTLVYLCSLPDTVEVLEFGLRSIEY